LSFFFFYKIAVIRPIMKESIPPHGGAIMKEEIPLVQGDAI
jgi:hypothetical protein